MRRWVKAAVATAALLGVSGWIAEPYARDWMLTGSACDGALPREAVGQLRPEDTHLAEESSRLTEALGSYACNLALDGEGLLVRMEAHTRRDDQDSSFMQTFSREGWAWQAPLPEGMPGFIDRHGAIQIVLPCRELGEDDNGRPRKLLVRTQFGRESLTGVPGAAYRTVVALANSASERLGCGAERLEPPETGAVPAEPGDDPESFPVPRAKGTPCEWVTRADLPESLDWRFAAAMNDAAPTGRCELFAGDGDEDSFAGEALEEDALEQWDRISLAAWYGDWSNRLTTWDGKRRSGTATARCDGEAANFAISAPDDIPGIDAAVERRLLKSFAEDQVRRRGCSDLRIF
ncbi:hypothetical protein [Streptomyces albus]|uniref:hypothetical protein n=1 Tax=Streptomyces albus TaxID=1888 RepID=UPI0004C90860|nr:hypothetical protein [Streptomyces albus]